jgi:hypothetical protein
VDLEGAEKELTVLILQGKIGEKKVKSTQGM